MIRIIAILITLNSILLNAQTSCGTIITTEEMEMFYNREKSYLFDNSTRNGTFLNIPIVYHLTRENNGTGGFKKSEAIRLHCELNESFIDAEIHFYILDIIEHDNTNYHHMNTSGSDMMHDLNNLSACNVFIVEEAKSGSYPVCGYSYRPESYPGPNRGGIVLDINCSQENSTTFSHEMGHYLNLAHTFYGWENKDYDLDPISSWLWERADGSNCSSSADGFCDTPADYISGRWTCNSPRTFQDAIGEMFTVDEKNYMSYSMDVCQAYFKPEQMAEMKMAPANFRSYLLNGTVPDTDPINVPITYFPLDNMQNTRFDTTKFVWGNVSGGTYYIFQISTNNFNSIIFDTILTDNNFTYYDLNQNQNYKWRVKAFNYGYTCSDFTTKSFKTSSTSNLSLDRANKINVDCKGNDNGIGIIQHLESVSSFNWYRFDETTSTYVFYNTTATNTLYNLEPTNYYVDIMKTSGNISTVHFEITEPNELTGYIGENGTYLVSFFDGGTPPYTYSWNNGETTYINFNPMVGENILFITDANSCYKSISHQYTPNSVQEIDNVLIDINFYPNPNKNSTLFIEFSLLNKDNVNFEIFTTLGKKMLSKSIKGQEGDNLLMINTSTFNKGVYFIKTSIDGVSSTSKYTIY